MSEHVFKCKVQYSFGTLDPSVGADIIQKTKDSDVIPPHSVLLSCFEVWLTNASFSFIGTPVHAIILASNWLMTKDLHLNNASFRKERESELWNSQGLSQVKQYTWCQAERAILKEQGSWEFWCVHRKSGSVPPVRKKELTEAVSTLKLEHHGEGGRWWLSDRIMKARECHGDNLGRHERVFKGSWARGHHFPSMPQRSCSWAHIPSDCVGCRAEGSEPTSEEAHILSLRSLDAEARCVIKWLLFRLG